MLGRITGPDAGAVALGSALGSLARYSVSLALWGAPGADFPWATLFVNVLGSVVIAFYATLSGPSGRLLASPAARQFFLVGVCGGFTTFSVFSVETVLLASTGRAGLAAGYVAASLLLWIPAAAVGHSLAQKLNRLPEDT